MIRVIFSLALLLLMLFAMKQWMATSKKIAFMNDIAEIKTEESCASAGGKLRPVCMRGIQTCIVQYKDVGKPCISGSQCEGECRVSESEWGSIFSVGRCSASNDPCGYWANVEFGLVQQGICRD